MSAQLKIFKIGGGIIDHAASLNEFLRLFAEITGPKILVHGGGKGASDLLSRLGVQPQLVNGRRVTDAVTLDIVTMFYAGKTNKHIVARLQQYGTNALGLTGADGNVIRAVKRPVAEIDYGFVGDLSEQSVDVALVCGLLDLGLVPVFCPINHDGHGQLLNTNADTVAASLAKALASRYVVELHFCFEKNGVLRNMADDDSVVEKITPAIYAELKAHKLIADGMLPKLDNAFAALDYGVEKVIIEHALKLHDTLKTTLCQN